MLRFLVNALSRISRVNFRSADACRAGGFGILPALQFGTLSGLDNKENRDGIHE